MDGMGIRSMNCIPLLGIILALTTTIMLSMSPTSASAETVVSGTFASNSNVAWSIDSDGLLSITGSGMVGIVVPWESYRDTITGITMDSTITPITMQGWFSRCTALQSVDARTWNLSRCTSLSSMFIGCSSLTSVDFNGVNTSRVTNISGMFDKCSSMTTCDVSGWNTSRVTNMDTAFMDCTALQTLDTSGWTTSACHSMTSIFGGCRSLTSVDVGDWDLSSCTATGRAFYDCESLTSIDIANWDMSHVTNIGSMFCHCYNLASIDVSRWDTSSIVVSSNVFQDDTLLTSIDVSGWTVPLCRLSEYMFDGCTGLQSLDLSNWNASSAGEMTGMFDGCTSLSSVKLGVNWSFTKPSDATRRAILPDPPSTSPYTGSWQAVGSGTLARPAGSTFTSAVLRDTYDGATMADTYLWQQRYPLTGSIAIEGGALVGQTVTAVPSGTPSDAALSYTWYRCATEDGTGQAVGTGQAYTLVEEDYGAYLFAVAVDSGGTYLNELRSPSVLASATISVTVPTDLHFTARGDGVLVCPTGAQLENASPIAVTVSSIALVPSAQASIASLDSLDGRADTVGLQLQPGSGTSLDLAGFLSGGAPPADEWTMRKQGSADSADTIALTWHGAIGSFGAIDPASDVRFAQIVWTIAAGLGG